MIAVLKYYFVLNDDGLYLDSVVCNGEVVTLPNNFLKWYEDGDLAPTDLEANDMMCVDSPMFWSTFATRKITFSIEDAKARLKCKE